MANKLFLVVCLVCYICFGFSESANASVPALFVFGDSLVDVGNNNYLPVSIAKANYPHNGVDFPTRKPTGRFCNGKNAADFIAEKLGLMSPPPYLSLKAKRNSSSILTGVSFASGGAGIFNGSDRTLGQSVPLSKQVDGYLSVHEELVNRLQPSNAHNHISRSLFAVVIGSNDLFDYFGSSNLRRKNNPQEYTELMSTQLKEQLKRLYDHGARKFLLVGVAQIGCIPGQRVKSPTEDCNDESNLWCAKYNEALKTMLQQLKSELQDLSYSFFDNYKAMHDVVANPSVYGFTDVKSACCGLGKLNAKTPCIPISKYCSDRRQHLFWDRYGHPTEAAAHVFVDFMFGGSSQYAFPLNVNQLIAV